MVTRSKYRPHASAVLVFFSAWVVLGAACATFHGPGDFQTGEAYDPREDEMPAPEATWRGERKMQASSEDIAFDWPVDDARLTQPFRLGKKRSHWGIDLGAPRGTPILSAEKGYVIYTGRGFRGYGNLVVIEHSPAWATLYAHLDKIQVEDGQFVRRGHVIGTMGRTGRASGVHLHFELRHNRQPVNPQAYLPPSS